MYISITIINLPEGSFLKAECRNPSTFVQISSGIYFASRMKTVYADVNNEYDKDKKLKREDVKALQEWADLQPHLPKISELQAILFLQSCYYSNEAAKTAIDTYFTVKTLCPDLFGNRNQANPIVKKNLNVTLFSCLPKLTPEGYQIVFVRLIDCNPDHYNFALQILAFDMVTTLGLYQKGTVNGHYIVFDMDGVVFGHLTKIGVLTLKKFLYYLQEGMPLRLKGIHYVNIVPFMDKILALMRPFLKKELLDVLYLHETIDGLDKFIPRDCMPQDYGGSVEPINILHEKFKQTIMDNAEHFTEEEKQVVDESKRAGKPKSINDVFGVEGTFKKLDID